MSATAELVQGYRVVLHPMRTACEDPSLGVSELLAATGLLLQIGHLEHDEQGVRSENGLTANYALADPAGGPAWGYVLGLRVADSDQCMSIVVVTLPTPRHPYAVLEATARFLDIILCAGAHKVMFDVFEFNRPVIRMLEKFGFRREGVSREATWLAGRWWSTVHISVLDVELRAALDRFGSLLRCAQAPPEDGRLVAALAGRS